MTGEGNTNKRRGTWKERKVRDDLRANGYLVARVTGSLGVADLIAMKVGETLFVQVKSKDYLPPGEWNDLYYTAMNVGHTPICAAVEPRKPIVYHKLAQAKLVQTKRPPWDPWRPDKADR